MRKVDGVTAENNFTKTIANASASILTGLALAKNSQQLRKWLQKSEQP